MVSVELKGKVACEMSSHELMITELVMEGVLTNLPTAEIAALLSCLVFQHKTDKEQKLTQSLERVCSFVFVFKTRTMLRCTIANCTVSFRVLKKSNEYMEILKMWRELLKWALKIQVVKWKISLISI